LLSDNVFVCVGIYLQYTDTVKCPKALEKLDIIISLTLNSFR